MAYILIIDDDLAIRGVIRKILEREGHEVGEAEDGYQGVEDIRRRVPDLVITDLIMPEKEGIETILELREGHPELRILAISGGGTVADREGLLFDAEALGADATLAKPFSIEGLVEKVDDLLG